MNGLPLKPANVVDASMAWTSRYIHEAGHWVRFHGSTIGILLVFLRRTRDRLAGHTLRQLDDRTLRLLGSARAAGLPILSSQNNLLADYADPISAERGEDWLALRDAYDALLDVESLESNLPARGGARVMDRALYLTWALSGGDGMLPYPPDYNGEVLTGRASQHVFKGSFLTTRLLLECAGVLDEMYPIVLGAGWRATRGAGRGIWDSGYAKMVGFSFSGEYGLPYDLASEIAGRPLANVVPAMIDFALNPPVPGLTPGVRSVGWDELYPPSRFVEIAKALRNNTVDLEFNRPDPEVLRTFYRQLEDLTGLRMGTIGSRLSYATSLSEAATTKTDIANVVPSMTLMYSELLLRERRQSPSSIPYFGLNFVGENVSRFVGGESIEETCWWLFPPLRVMSGKYCWPLRRINLDEATDLFIATAAAAALDDIIAGVGPLSSGHLPPWDSPGDAELLGTVVRDYVGLDVSWS